MIPLTLPPNAQVRGCLQTPDDDITLLREGLLLVTVGDYGINVDRLDEHDPAGEYVVTVYVVTVYVVTVYVVTVYKDDFENEVGEGLVTRDVQAVKRFVESEAARLATPVRRERAVRQ